MLFKQNSLKGKNPISIENEIKNPSAFPYEISGWEETTKRGYITSAKTLNG